MTFESSLPYVSVVAAIAAAAIARAAPRPVETGLKAAALGAAALFAYFRWIAPTEVALAFTLSAAGQAFSPRQGEDRRGVGPALLAGAWMALGYLFLQAGDGRAALLTDPVKAALLAGLIIGAGFGFRRLWPCLPRPRRWMLAEAAALVLMAAGAITLDWEFWPALAGVAGLLAGEGLALIMAGGRITATSLLRRMSWGLAYLGQAAIAYAFLR